MKNRLFTQASKRRWLYRVIGPVLLAGLLTANPIQAQETPRSFADLADKVAHSVVNIATTQKIAERPGMPWLTPEGPLEEYFDRFFGDAPQPRSQTQALGSGFLIDQQGHIFTNNHVVAKASEIRVRLQNGNEYDAKVIGRDPQTDLALIRIETKDKLPPPASLGDSDNLRVGDWAIAVGNPFGLGHSVTVGIIGAKSRVIGAGPYDDFLQTDAAINPGNSGGPLYDSEGQVIGINTAIVAQGQGIGFAVPINMAKELLPQLKKGSVVRGYLGIGIQDVTTELSEALDLKQDKGAIVTRVMEGTPAEKAGLKEGDVIVSVNGQPVESAHVLSANIAGIQPGGDVEISILRDGNRQKISAKVGRMPGTEVAQAAPSEEPPKWGLGISDLTPEMARRLDLESNQGVVVVEVAPNSPADRAGLQPGDVIRSVDREKIQNTEEFMQAIEEQDAGTQAEANRLVLQVQRQDQYFYAVLKEAA